MSKYFKGQDEGPSGISFPKGHLGTEIYLGMWLDGLMSSDYGKEEQKLKNIKKLYNNLKAYLVSVKTNNKTIGFEFCWMFCPLIFNLLISFVFYEY